MGRGRNYPPPLQLGRLGLGWGEPGLAGGKPPETVAPPTWPQGGWPQEGELLSPSLQWVSGLYWPVQGEGGNPHRPGLGARAEGLCSPTSLPLLPHWSGRYKQGQAVVQKYCCLHSVAVMGQGQPWLSWSRQHSQG